MTDRRLEPPGGDAAPTTGWLTDDEKLELAPLAQEVCLRYRSEFPDEEERYGSAGHAWCVHDNQHLLYWATEAVHGYVDMEEQVGWLARVLEARAFPLVRLARNLDLAADVVREQVEAPPGDALGDALARAAEFVRSRETFLTL